MRRFAALAAVAVLACALPAFADDGDPSPIPTKGDATVTLLGGWRAIPQHDFTAENERDGNYSHSLFQPGGVLSLGFAADDEFHVTIDVGYGIDSWQTSIGTAKASMVTLLLGADTPLFVTPVMTIYAGGGLGYSLNTFTAQGTDQESNSSAGFLRVGARFRLSRRLAFVIEDRYVVSSALWPTYNANMNVGGNLLTIGLMVHFFSPEDPGHPQGPSSTH